MQAVQSAPAEESSIPFKIVIISDNFNASLRARFIAERLVAVLESQVTLISGAWQFEVLSSTPLQESTAIEARGAGLIVVSASGDVELPAHLKEWLHDFVPPDSGRPSALVALLDQEQETLPWRLNLRQYLSELAREKQMQFLCPHDRWEELELEYDA
jgi:hypothetical protein